MQIKDQQVLDTMSNVSIGLSMIEYPHYEYLWSVYDGEAIFKTKRGRKIYLYSKQHMSKSGECIKVIYDSNINRLIFWNKNTGKGAKFAGMKHGLYRIKVEVNHAN